MISDQNLQKTPLYEKHVSLKARMVPFGGWDMPVQYEGILAEYQQTRTLASLFDTCHMGEFFVEGDCVKSGLDHLVSMTIADMPLKTCRYGFLLNEQGGVIDDLIVFRQAFEKWFIVVNASTISKDAQQFKKHLTSASSFKDLSPSTGKLDLQGPLARNILSSLVEDIKKLDYYTFDFFDLFGQNVLISRTGYTGELGYEIYYPAEKIGQVWDALLKFKEVKPAGLGARDVLRLEVGYSLYGHELSDDITPLEAGLERFIDFNKDFIGKTALLKQKQEGLKRKSVGLISESRRSPRAEQKLYDASGKEIGVMTSGTFSPSLQKGIGLGMVEPSLAEKGKTIYFGNDTNKEPAVVSGKLFYKKGSLKN
ncbi:MAG: glycine cleavage system aminomethyltransferase GcvT [Candidatus Omnitrophica bacterium]|nr:glycine cleavage system aminomethyltransferase GcvT [Candidatus Omnitrophota bacterium]